MPLMFTVIFGLFFGKNSNVAGSIAIVNKSNSEIAQNLDKTLGDSGLFTVQKNSDLEAEKESLSKNKISAVVYVPENFGNLEAVDSKELTVYVDPASAQATTILTTFLNQYLTQTSFKIQNAKPMFLIKQEQVGSGKTFSYFDFVMAGILGMALMNASIMGMAVGISKYKEDKILKRITTTPLKTWKFLFAEVLSRLVLNIMQITLILVLGVFVFDGHVYGNIFVLFAVVMLGAILFQLIGFVMAGFAKSTSAAEGMAQAVAIPMMFLGGVFFPIDALPKWLFSIVQFLPLAPLLRMIRGISIDSASPFSNPMNMGIVIGWIAVASIVSILKFRMAEE